MRKFLSTVRTHIDNNKHFAALAMQAVRDNQFDNIPEHVLFPISFGVEYAKAYNQKLRDAWEYSTYLNWWYTKGIYTIKEDLIGKIVPTELGNKPLPFELLYKMPEWAIFIPYGKQNIEGFLCSIDWFDDHMNTLNYKEELRITVFFETGVPLPLFIPFISGMGIKEAIITGIRDGGVNYDGSVFEPIFKIANIGINLLLYICCKNADIKHRMKRSRQLRCWV